MSADPASPASDDNENTWQQYHKLVVFELERHNTVLSHLDAKIDEIRAKDLPGIREQIATLKVQSSLWGGLLGGLAGLIPVLGAILLRYLSH